MKTKAVKSSSSSTTDYLHKSGIVERTFKNVRGQVCYLVRTDTSINQFFISSLAKNEKIKIIKTPTHIKLLLLVEIVVAYVLDIKKVQAAS